MQDNLSIKQEEISRAPIPLSAEDQRIVADALGIKQDSVYQVVAGNAQSARVRKASYAWMRIKTDSINQLKQLVTAA